jgi:hypothetical protein
MVTTSLEGTGGKPWWLCEVSSPSICTVPQLCGDGYHHLDFETGATLETQLHDPDKGPQREEGSLQGLN